MSILKLSDKSVFEDLVETGMGYHFVRAKYGNSWKEPADFLVLGSTYALPIEKEDGLTTIFELASDAALAIDRWPAENFVEGVLDVRENFDEDPLLAREELARAIRQAAIATSFTGVPPPPPPPGATLTVKAKTSGDDAFLRFSYTRHDPRISGTGQVRGKTYATTYRDGVVVTSGLSALARYALPVPLPAEYVFLLTPPQGVDVELGAAAPLFGQSGGVSRHSSQIASRMLPDPSLFPLIETLYELSN
ncbi:MAG TPA: hypothetical protein VF179_33370 [Thermoanaerobaculia bacterium]|nr:hypothetical protein [Thermoanaerobaculia bacterium]